MPTTSTRHLDDDDGPFIVTSQLEIKSLLRAIEQKNALLRMHVRGRSVAIITTILQIDAKTDMLIIDNSADEEFNRRITTAENVAFETLLDRVRIQFTASHVATCMHDGRPALQLPLPTTLTRIQRREYYRVDTPVTNPARCTFTFEKDKERRSATLDLKDISAGGIAVIDSDGMLDCTKGTTYNACRLELPEVDVVDVDLRVVQCMDDLLQNGKERRLLGLKFFNLPNPQMIKVQHYIGVLERKLNAKRRGFE